MKQNKTKTFTWMPTIEAFGVTHDVAVIAARIKRELEVEAEDIRRTGEEYGRRWAAETANFDELSALERLRGEDISFDQLCRRFDALAELISLDDDDVRALRASPNAYAFGSGFVTGALEVWDLVQPNVER